ncbi:CAP domain-containing protein [Massilia sp. H6]|uniref:CAP domain-containing protein n=1 Tax=Massilia sp. H6 TaxID=2970464 RepID=UPI002167FBE9|nr:CAP domain-containing protein [Massilia sp. H6]UVW29287.1 CAP domain-containing protein [Massilia sp. H6]
MAAHFLPFLLLPLLALASSSPSQAAAAPLPANRAEALTSLVNAYRKAPGTCGGRAVAPVDALTTPPALARVRIGPATFIEAALERAGYAADHAETVSVTGPQTAADAMTVLQEKYCKTLLNPRFSAVGSYREGNTWTVLLARPSPPLPSALYPDWRDAGQAILARVNAARASKRTCGTQAYPPSAPLRWDPELGQAALAHSRDMAALRYFSHQAKDGSTAAERARRAGYQWQRVGENIAFGQRTPEEVVAGWLDSPGHCANIMNPGFTEMGAAYGMASEHRAGLIYWTQVFGRRR